MPGFETSLRAPDAERLLGPREVLRRLRPVKLSTILPELRSYGYQCQALTILRKYGRLPKKYKGQQGKRGPNWVEIFVEFLRNCERWDWFAIDWAMLQQGETAWYESGEMNYFANWLTCIPIERYGFSDYDEEWPEQYPVIALIKALLDDDWGSDFIGDLVEQYGLVADWSSITHYQLQERIVSHDFRHYGAPLCWLPDVAKIAMGQTGNDLLDYSNYFEDEPTHYSWAEDLEQAKAAYREAKPWVEKLRAFLRWCDGPYEMQAVVNALVGLGERPKRKRKPKKQSKLNTLIDILVPGVEQ